MPRIGWALLVVAFLVAGCAQEAKRAPVATVATPATTPKAISKRAVRAQARKLAAKGKYAAAATALTAAGLKSDAAKVKRRGARALAHSAQNALARGRFTTAKRLAAQSRRLRKTAAASAVISAANTRIAQAKAAERIARDQRTCTSAEKALVRADAGRPPGCETYAPAPTPAPTADDCDPNYTGACLKPDSYDYDCESGEGDGPDYTGPVQVVGDDPYGLDRDGDGAACEG